jgi:hypothetical protein
LRDLNNGDHLPDSHIEQQQPTRRERGGMLRVVEDVIAVEVLLADGERRFFLTWGRVHDPVDPGPVCALVLRFAERSQLGGTPSSARVCESLREAAESVDAPYFYECFYAFCQRRIEFAEGYEAWRQERVEAMEDGKEIAYCGQPVAS